MARRIIIGILVFLSTAGFVWADSDLSDTDLADTSIQEVKIKEQKSDVTDPGTYRIGRTNLRMNKKNDDYNWNTAGDDEAVNPLGTSYGLEW